MRTFPTILLSLLIITAAAQNMPRLVPEAYWGMAFMGGNPASNGSEITVGIQDTGEVVGKGRVITDDGLYSLDVIFDNELTDKDEGAEEGQKLLWKINGIPCKTPAPGYDLANSGHVNANFTISADRISAGTEEPITLPTTTTKSVQNTGNSSLLWPFIIGTLILAGILLIARQRR